MRRPISARRSVTETSITFMIPTPATASETDAIPTSARVSAFRIDENAEISASWVIDRDVLGAVTLGHQAFHVVLGLLHLGVRRARPPGCGTARIG